ncbi:MAG: SDR family NAD(P)-dependent oxidoreductase [Deltaproteobacteria bacterium]|nr:SDR family NAD(P)-dependent oxidoreductase [Deltaproteobacteria bacterium]
MPKYKIAYSITSEGLRMKISGRKNAVITGAGSGLGRALAIALARRGWKILAADIDKPEADVTLEMVKQAGGLGEAMHCDVTKIADVQKMADYCFDQWGGVDLLVNNAGVAAGGLTGDIPVEDWHWIVNVNFWGMVYGCHALIPKMKAAGGGYIVNVASAAGFTSLPEMASYNATKAAIISLSETLKSELAPYNIGITVVCPTFFNTNILQDMRCTNDFQRRFAKAAFENAWITSEKIAKMIIKAIEKNRLYVIPQLSGKLIWIIKRISPSLFYSFMALLMRVGIARKLLLLMARLGMT